MFQLALLWLLKSLCVMLLIMWQKVFHQAVIPSILHESDVCILFLFYVPSW